MRVPRPLAFEPKRLNCGAASTMMRVTFRSSMSRPWLFWAFSTADHSTLCTRSAPFLGMNLSVLSAFDTCAPRTVSATSRHFCGEMRAYLSFRSEALKLRRGVDHDARDLQVVDVETLVVLGVFHGRPQHLVHQVGALLGHELERVERLRHLRAAHGVGHQPALLRRDARVLELQIGSA